MTLGKTILSLIILTSMFLLLTGLVLIVDEMWKDFIINEFESNRSIGQKIGFYMVKLLMAGFGIIVIVGTLLGIVQAMIGRFFELNVSGGGKGAGVALGIPGIGILVIITVAVLSVLAVNLIDFITYHLPAIMYFGFIALLIARGIKRGIQEATVGI